MDEPLHAARSWQARPPPAPARSPPAFEQTMHAPRKTDRDVLERERRARYGAVRRAAAYALTWLLRPMLDEMRAHLDEHLGTQVRARKGSLAQALTERERAVLMHRRRSDDQGR